MIRQDASEIKYYLLTAVELLLRYANTTIRTTVQQHTRTVSNTNNGNDLIMTTLAEDYLGRKWRGVACHRKDVILEYNPISRILQSFNEDLRCARWNFNTWMWKQPSNPAHISFCTVSNIKVKKQTIFLSEWRLKGPPRLHIWMDEYRNR